MRLDIRILARIEKHRRPKVWVSLVNLNYLFKKGYVNRPETPEDYTRAVRESTKYRWAMYGYKWALAKMASEIEGTPFYPAYMSSYVSTDEWIYSVTVRKPFHLLLVDKENQIVLEEYPPTEDIRELIPEEFFGGEEYD